MTTFVGTQIDFSDALKEMVELEYDAIEAYEAAINRIDNTLYKNKMLEFKKDHDNHILELTAILNKHKFIPPDGPSIKRWLTKGKVILADIVGDTAILSAMYSNEEDTNIAYKKLNAHEDIWKEAQTFLRNALEDEMRHRVWFLKAMRNI